MRIALFSDIHANREAFAACLAHAERAGAERMIVLGDLVGYGADPVWAVDAVAGLASRGAVVLRGNHDAAVEDGGVGMNPIAREAIDWTRAQLDPDQKRFLAGLPLAHEEGDRLFVHANAAAPADWGYVLGPEDARRSLTATPAREIFCGHVHVPALYNLSPTLKVGTFTPVPDVAIPLLPTRQWLAVLGAVGQPRDRDPAACYGLLDTAAGTLTYVRVPYDVATAAAKIRRAGLPEQLAARLERGM